MTAIANDLESGFEILWYKIESVLGRGGFGITYLATDTNLGQLVAIKEYLPHDFASRSGDSTVQPASVEQNDMYVWGLERFMSEAQTLAKFKHKNIVRVLSVFKHNNTGYMVMEYEEGEDLSVVYKSGKKLSQDDLEKIYYPIMAGLASVHKEGFIHRDIKPANIFIRKDGSPVLIDFGAARQAVGNKTQALTAMLSVGYAPFEQYNDASGRQGPWTDIYAIGASMYQGITGRKPMESTVRGMALLHLDPDPYEALSQSALEGYSYDFLRAIDQALKLQITERPQNLEEFLAELKGEIHLAELPPKKPEPKFDETLIRPVDRGFKGQEIKHEQEDIQTEVSKTDVDEKPAAEVSQAKKSDLKSGYKNILIIGLSLLLLIVVTFFLWPEKTPEHIRQQKIEALLQEAESLIENEKYYSNEGDSAFERYSRVLKLQPDNVNANTGINNVAQHYLTQAVQYISHQKLTEARTSIEIVSSIDADFPGLSEVQAKLKTNQNQLKKSQQVFVFMEKAREALSKKDFYQPLESSALSYFNKVLNVEPENLEAAQGVKQIADKISLDINDNLNTGNYKTAQSLFILAEHFNPQTKVLTNSVLIYR